MVREMAKTDLDPLDIWRRAMVENVHRDAPDLSARQMAVLLTVYMTRPPHTVRGLADILNVSKPAITRALDRLGEFKLARRKSDARDRRSVLVQRTVMGSVYLSEFADIIAQASAASNAEKAAKLARKAKRQANKAAAAKAPGAKATARKVPPAQAAIPTAAPPAKKEPVSS
jgi:DNA-binding MarR family transcriptional regulator